MFLILSSTHMTAMIWVQFREMKPEPNHGFYLLKPTWNHMWSGSGLGPVKPETKSSLIVLKVQSQCMIIAYIISHQYEYLIFDTMLFQHLL